MTNTSGGPLIFPLNRVSRTDVAALQFALRPLKLSQPAFMQQRLRAFQGRLAPKVPVNLPWNAVGMPSLVDVPVNYPRVVHQLLPAPATEFKISGITKDGVTSAVIPGCTVHIFRTSDDYEFAQVVSDAAGYYEWRYASPSFDQYAVAYIAGSPDKAGTTLNTLRGT